MAAWLVGDATCGLPDPCLHCHRRSSTACGALQAGIVGLPNVGKVLKAAETQPQLSTLLTETLAACPHSPCLKGQPACVAAMPADFTAHQRSVSGPVLPVQSTLFNAIVENGKAAAANFPFCTIEPNTVSASLPASSSAASIAKQYCA